MSVTAEKCWACSKDFPGGHFCPHCRKIQPLRGGENYFDFMGIPRRLELDPDLLQTRFYALSRQFHPDFYQGKSAEEKKISLDRASFLNKAYQTLREPESRAAYLFDLEAIPSGQDAKASPDLLSKVFEMQELAAEAKDNGSDMNKAGAKLGPIEADLKNCLGDCERQMRVLFSEWDSEASAYSENNGERKNTVAGKIRRLINDKRYIEETLRAVTQTSGTRGDR
ncbi:MAG TPA: Fe-S protein assembly co-chaperone HscB [Candidatus Omnitrophota bacterium]|nr:Fe-S protein assembly co-chaperone HscB [Candidatus Omnitrophota bacterium]